MTPSSNNNYSDARSATRYLAEWTGVRSYACCEHSRAGDLTTCSSVQPQWGFIESYVRRRIWISSFAPRRKTSERLRAALRDVYDSDPHIEDISSADLLGEYPAIRYYPSTGDIYFDVLTRLGESVQVEDVEAEVKEIEGTRVRVATPAALYRLKKGTIRVQDQLDAAALRAHFNLKDES